jgi:hypothetical protein
VLTRQGSFFRYHYFLDVLVLVLSTLCGITFIAGPRVQPTRFPFSGKPFLKMSSISSFYLPQSASVFIPGRRPRLLPSIAQDCASICLPLSSIHRLSNVSPTTHRMLSHLALALSHFLHFVQIRKAKYKVVQKSDHGRLTYL